MHRFVELALVATIGVILGMAIHQLWECSVRGVGLYQCANHEDTMLFNDDAAWILAL